MHKLAALTLLTAAVVLCFSTEVLPWATYKQLTTGFTTTFEGGPIAAAVVGLAVVVAVIAAIIWRRPYRWLYSVTALLAAATFGTSVALALDKIAAANSLPQFVPTQTSYSYGSGVGLLAALAMFVVSLGSRHTPVLATR